jgi:hypothetical protein
LQRLYLVEVSVNEVIGHNSGDDDKENGTLWWPCFLFPDFATMTNIFFGSMTYDKDANQTKENNNRSKGSMPWFMPSHDTKQESTTTRIQAKLTLESLQQLYVSTEPTPVVYLLGPPRDNLPLSLYLSSTTNQERVIKEFWANIPDLVASSLQYPPLEQAKLHAMYMLEQQYAATTATTRSSTSSSSSLVDRPSTTGTTVTTARRYPSAGVSWYPPVAAASTEPSLPPPPPLTFSVGQSQSSNTRSGAATVVLMPEKEDEARPSLSLEKATTVTHSDSPVPTIQPPGQEAPPTPKHSNLKRPPSEPPLDRTNDNDDNETMFPTSDTREEEDVAAKGQQPLEINRKSATQSSTISKLPTAFPQQQQQEQKAKAKGKRGRPNRTGGQNAKAVVPAVPYTSDNPVSTATSSVAVARQPENKAPEKGKMARKARTNKTKYPKNKTTSPKNKTSRSELSPRSSSTTATTPPPLLDPASSTRKKRSPPATDQVQETGEELDVPTFSDVKPLLQKLGYTFPRGRYCLPSSSSSPPLSFATESDFRNHLCQTHVQWEGFEFPKSKVEQVQGILLRYVRYSILSNLIRGDEQAQDSSRSTRPSLIPELEMPVQRFTKWILALGFKYLTTGLYGGYYALPGVTSPHFQKDGPHANVFLEKPGLWNYLARQGLPHNCDFDKLTDMQRLSLEQCIAQYGLVHLAKETL